LVPCPARRQGASSGGNDIIKKIFYGWWIVLATSIIHFWSAGTFFYSFTAFFNPIAAEFGWSYAAISFAASLRSIEGGIASPIVGFAADRYGPRSLLFIGSILSGFGFIFLGKINSLWSFYLLFIFLSITLSLTLPVPGWTAVANWFVTKRGTAIGILSASVGMGGLLIYTVNWLIGIFGWRYALTLIGVIMWIVGIPASLVVRHRPEPYGFFPDGEVYSQSILSDSKRLADNIQTDKTKEFSVRQALKTRSFWLLVAAVTISNGTVHAVIVHIMPYLISLNFARERSSIIASGLVFVSVVGRLGLGWLTNRINTRYLLAIALFLQVLGLIILSRIQNFWQALFFVLLYGPGYGGVITLRLTLLAEYFGRRSFGTIQGIVMAIAIVATMSFPLLTGIYYDLFGSYQSAWLIMAMLVFVSIPFALKARPPQPHENKD